MNFAEKLQALRKQQNISQEKLAQEMYVTRQAVSKWENGESVPDIENIVRLSQVLGVSTDYLIKDTAPAQPASTGHSPLSQSNNDSELDLDNSLLLAELDPVEDYVPLSKRIENAINPIATLVFFALGLFYGLWHPGWIVFVVAWVIKHGLKYSRTGKFGISISDCGLIALLVVGFVFRRWDVAFFALIAAWVLDEVLTPKKPSKKKRKNMQK